jgi:hypothetical protein
MKRKIIFVMVLAALLAGTSFAASRPKTFGLTAIGGYYSWGYTGNTNGFGLSLKFGSFPVVGVKYNFTGAGSLGASVDWYIIDSAGLIDSLTYFLGVGAYANIDFGQGGGGDIGLRGNIGLQLWPIRMLELYIDVIPAVGFLPTPHPGIGLDAGLRFHF